MAEVSDSELLVANLFLFLLRNIDIFGAKELTSWRGILRDSTRFELFAIPIAFHAKPTIRNNCCFNPAHWIKDPIERIYLELLFIQRIAQIKLFSETSAD